MHRILLTIALIAAPGAAAADTIKDSLLGCRNYNTYEQILRMSITNASGSAALLEREVSAGNCIIWEKATQVRRVESRVTTTTTPSGAVSVSCFARVGTAECFWTQNDMVEPAR